MSDDESRPFAVPVEHNSEGPRCVLPIEGRPDDLIIARSHDLAREVYSVLGDRARPMRVRSAAARAYAALVRLAEVL